MRPENSIEIKLLEKKCWRDGLVTLRFEKPKTFAFEIGQFVRIGLEDANGNYTGRAYSLASLPTDDYIELLVVAVDNGALSPRLVALEEGDSVILESYLFGQILPKRILGGSTLWLLASGTGLAPFISFIRSPFIWESWSLVVLVHSVRHLEDLAYRTQIETLSKELATYEGSLRRLIYVPVVTQEHSDALHERIPQLIDSGLLEEKAGIKLNAEDSRVILCGNPQMVQDVRQLLKTKGFVAPRRRNPGNLLAEALW